MEYQKIANLLERTPDNFSKFRTRNWVEINDESRGNYANGDIKFKTTMLRSNLCDYADSLLEQEMLLLQDRQMKEIKK